MSGRKSNGREASKEPENQLQGPVEAQLSFWPDSRRDEPSISSKHLPFSSQHPKFTIAAPGKRTGKCMSRRTGQSGHIERSGKWWVARWWMDVADQEKRVHKRARVCPVSGPGVLSPSARERRAREIISKSGADTEEHFNKVVKQESGVTFREQSVIWFEQVKTRKRKPVATSTLELWEGCLRNWLNPNIGDFPLSEVNNAALKSLVATMQAGKLSAKTIGTYSQVVKMVVASARSEEHTSSLQS